MRKKFNEIQLAKNEMDLKNLKINDIERNGLKESTLSPVVTDTNGIKRGNEKKWARNTEVLKQ